jgi:transposase InsO family protein
LCEALLVSRSGYYDWVERRRQPGPRQVESARLRERIREEFARSHQTYGSPRLAYALGCPGRRNRIARLMRAERLFARQRSKYRPRTTDSRHGGPIAPNRLQNLTVHRPDQVWVTDATGILTGQGWLYLVAVLDLHTRRVIGWAMHQILDARLVSAALRMGLLQRRPRRGLIVHSDRGMQFASAAYRQILAQHGLVASMSRPGNCYDNAFIESFWSSLKYELVYHQRFATQAEARTAEYEQRLREARMTVFKSQEARRQLALQARAAAVAEARTGAQGQVEKARAAIEQDRVAAQAGLQAESGKLAAAIIRTVLQPAAQSPAGGD